jgi:hypothetical protein
VTASLTTVAALLKEVYGPRIESQQQEETTTIKRIERTSDGVTDRAGGKYVDFPIKVGRNHGISYRQEWEALAPAGKQKYDEVHVPLYYGYARVKLSTQMLELASSNYQAFANAWDEEMDGIKDDVVKDSNRIVYGNGNGLLASVAVDMGAPGLTFTVDDIKWLEVDMPVDILVIATGAALATSRNITAINESTKAVTIDGANITATNPEHGLFRPGNFAAGTQREPTGWGKIISATGSLHGVDPATQPKWASQVTTGVGALSEGVMIELMDKIRTKGGKPSVIFTSLAVRREYFYLLQQQRRFNDPKKFEGGLVGLAFNYGAREIPVVEEVDHPEGEMTFVSEDKMKVYRTQKWHWSDEDGNTFKWVSGYDGWEAYMRQYWEIGTSNRNHHGKLTGITTT